MEPAQIVDQIRADQIAAAHDAEHARQRLGAAVRRGLRAEARLVAAQAAAYGPQAAARLAARRGRDRAAVLAAVLGEVAS